MAPDVSIDEVVACENSLLLLPGADTWSDSKHAPAIAKAGEMLDAGGIVAAICGATAALASTGLLDNRPHTSNGAGFLEMFAPGYKGAAHYKEAAVVVDGNLITAGATGAIPWTRLVIDQLGVMDEGALQSWQDYFTTGDAKHFFALWESVSMGER